MATLVLGFAGAAAGGALLPSGAGVLGATLSGAAIGQAAGAIAGGIIDQALFGPSGQSRVVEGPRLSDFNVSSSTEGAPIARVYGRARLPGQLIWATRFEEEIIRTEQTTGGGGKGLSGPASPKVSETRIEYRYYANVAYAVAEGEIDRVGRIWADGKEIDQSGLTFRVHKGSETQAPDSLIEAKQGAGLAPAYRGTAYVVFERLALARFGNRLPQFNFEVFRAVDDFEKTVRAINIIPGAGEFVLEQDEIRRIESAETIAENVHTSQGGTDWDVAIDQLADQLPNVTTAGLVVSWFGTDLRVGNIEVRPKVEVPVKETEPDTWSVAGVARPDAAVVSQHDGSPAFGGTPSDKSVVSAIKDLKARGFEVSFYPFINMDIPAGNALPDPISGGGSQPDYPWRGRITVYPGPDQPGTPDKTAAAATQVANLVGTANVGDFTIDGEEVGYAGPTEWSLRRMILHYAHLCKAAGGVDAFLIGSELVGVTTIRDGAGSYPFVDALVDLAADVKSVLGSGTEISYAADWSEYFGHQPQDGSGDVYFHLDPLWACDDIDAIAIDYYHPLSDWRDGDAHLDRISGAESIYDLDYLKGNITGGEGYDWYYQDDADREAQVRTPITDGAGKPWVYRFKDLKRWWQNQHYNRPGGTEAGSPTGWVPESKPFWFTEMGCPAVDKGSNQPNKFIDPKSSESVAPHFSRTIRDDLIQRRYIQAVYDFHDPAHEDYVSGSNPVSSVYGDRMVDLDKVTVWTWDARPYPAFPFALDVWTDGGNWEFGHWLNGRVAGGPLAAVIAAIMGDFGFNRFSVGGLSGQMHGYVIDRILSLRDVIQPLELAFFFDSYESGGLIQFAHRGRTGPVATLRPDDLVETDPERDPVSLTRGQETELPASAKLTYIDGNVDYRQAVAEARRLAGASERVSTASMPIVMDQAQAQRIAETWLQDAWQARERGRMTLPPTRLALEPGDVVTLETSGRLFDMRIVSANDAQFKTLETRSIEPDVFVGIRTPQRTGALPAAPVFGAATMAFLDLPLLSGNETPHAGFVAATQRPWPGAVAFYRSPSNAGYTLNTVAAAPATMGVTEYDFYAGPTSRFDRGNLVRVRLDDGELESIDELALLAGGNVAAIQNSDGGWEVFQFQQAALVGERTYDLSLLLRGQAGTERAMRNFVAAGAPFVLINSAVSEVTMTADEIGLAFNWKVGPIARDVGDNVFADVVHAFEGRALKPLSPVHVRGQRDGNDVSITWIRRSRLNADALDIVDPPLAENLESYEVDILDGSEIKRTLAATSPSATYTATDQIADFGTIQSSYDVKVYQMSAVFGRGTPRDATLHV